MAKNYLPLFYSDWDSVLDEYSDKDVGALVRALLNHANGREVGILRPNIKVLFSIISGSADRYASKCKINAENGRKGGAPKGNRNAAKQPKQPKTTENESCEKEKQPKQAKTSPIPLPYHSITSISKDIHDNGNVNVYGFDPAAQGSNPSAQRSLIQKTNVKIHKIYASENQFAFSEQDATSIIDYFLDAYAKTLGGVHPSIPQKTLKSILERLSCFEDGNGRSIDITAEYYPALIDAYFTEELDCDYNLSHFMSGAIRANRFYEKLY